MSFLHQKVNPVWAYGIIFAVAAIASYLVFQAYQGLYEDQTALYNSLAEQYRLERQEIVQPKIGTGISTP